MKFSQVVIGSLVAAALAASGSTWARPAPAALGPSFSNMAWFMVAFELGPWEEYLIQELTPDLDILGDDMIAPVSWIAMDESLLLPDFALALLQPASQRPSLTLARNDIAVHQLNAVPALNGGQSLERSLVMSGITAPVSDRSAFSVAAVLATQRFVAAGMNLTVKDEMAAESSQSTLMDGPREVAYGAGMRFAVSSEPTQGMTLEAGFQSRISMNEFATVRGVHGSQAELDIPSRINMGLNMRTSARGTLHLGVAQIFYSEVGAFPSRALPARFNALLGDSTSPEFAWEDLTVYSIGWSWRTENAVEFVVDYRSRSQPRPSSPDLAAALAPELAQNAWLVGLGKDLNERSRLQLNAAYAPPEYAFGGNVLGVVSDQLGQSFEVQAQWRLKF